MKEEKINLTLRVNFWSSEFGPLLCSELKEIQIIINATQVMRESLSLLLCKFSVIVITTKAVLEDV